MTPFGIQISRPMVIAITLDEVCQLELAVPSGGQT